MTVIKQYNSGTSTWETIVVGKQGPVGPNAGLELVTTCTVTSTGGTAATASGGVITIGTNNTSVTVSNAFSSSYDRYLITISGGTASVTDDGFMTLGSTSTGYYSTRIRANYNTPSTAWDSDNNAAQWSFAFRSTSGKFMYGHIVVDNPYNAEYTTMETSIMDDSLSARVQGFLNNTTSYTSFKLALRTGNMSDSKVRVYGYRNS